ncbi:MAG: PilZ domain-containing protein [Vicinamibacteraceae bacterium]|nr:PilZ domain-containing protein [Vicinamibacteraceae bacterium]
MPYDRRRRTRQPVADDATGAVSLVQPVRILELSELGARIEVALPLQIESLHDFRLELFDSTVVVKGRVAHCELVEIGDSHTLYRAGIEFVDTPDHVLAAVAGYLVESRQGRTIH